MLHVGSKRIRRDPVLTPPIVLKLMALGRYEKPERDLLAFMLQNGFIGRGDRVVEAGGGLGTLTMEIADIVGDSEVFVFEANPRAAKGLRENLALNGHQVSLTEAALAPGDQTEVSFADRSETSGFAVSSIVDPGRDAKRIVVPAASLQRTIDRIDPTVLVLDVEGAEVDLLGSVEHWGRLRAIHLELHPDVVTEAQLDSMSAALIRAGFRRHPIPDFGSKLALFVRSAEPRNTSVGG